MSDVIDSKILDQVKIIQEKKNKIAAAKVSLKRSWKTNMSLPLTSGAAPLNINVATESKLREAMKMLLITEDYDRKAAVELGVEFDGKYFGYAYDDWKEDLCKRMNSITLKSEEEKLAKLEEKLNKLVSPEKRRELELEDIIKELSK